MAKQEPKYEVLMDPDEVGANWEDKDDFVKAVMNLAGCRCGGALMYTHMRGW